MTRNPEPTRRLTTVGFVALGAVVLSSGVALADPSESEARERYEELQEELSVLNEAYNTAEEDHAAAEEELADLQEQLEEAQQALDDRSERISGIVQSSYTNGSGGGFDIFFGGDADSALQNIADVDFISAGQQEMLSDYVIDVDHAEELYNAAQDTEEEAAEALTAAEEAMTQGESALDEQAEVLERLGGVDPTASQASTTSADSGSSGSSGGTAAVSGDVQAVLDFARAQIGKPYVWGGTGPDGYDCSGLTQAAWSQAGVSLPRTTYDQVNAGTSVSRDQLQPGDLLFFYSASAPSHVGIYSGNGRMIHGSNPSKPLEEIDLASYWDSVFTGAVRPG
ncbi:MAG TPA: C40 family peptidase [Nocardiopsis listeri]|uniref:C40 family peptidase n=1 Tax=Nocardiopsis listeri TaxID=53440 RepID=UPI001D78905A|nr:C40 family peptidase [Nocardiopsis listeri]HJE60750.1 C40 family peptidase [Nocardiopsis listeri]